MPSTAVVECCLNHSRRYDTSGGRSAIHTDQQAAGQIRALLGRLPVGGPLPWFVFDGGYDSAQLTLDLADLPVAVLVRLRSGRCFYADPPSLPPGKTGRPRRYGAKFNFADPSTWPAPTASHVVVDDQYGTVTVAAWAGLHPKQQRHPGHGSRGPRPIVRGTIIRVQVERVPARTARRRCCGCGGPVPTSSTWTWRGGRMSAGSTSNTPSGSPNRPSAGRLLVLAIPSRPTGGPGWCWPPTSSCAWPARSPATGGCHGSGPDPSRGCRRSGCAVGFRDLWPRSARQPPRRNPPAAPQAGPRAAAAVPPPLPGHEEAQQEAEQGCKSRLISRHQHQPAASDTDGQPRTPRV
jgi:DDE superfamily endonuclease